MDNERKLLKEISKNLIKLREAKHFSQKELAQAMKIAQPQYGKVERGEVVPSLPTLLKAAKALEVSIDTIIYGETAFTESKQMSGYDPALINKLDRISKLPPKERFMANELLKLIFTRDSLKNIVSDYDDVPDGFIKR